MFRDRDNPLEFNIESKFEFCGKRYVLRAHPLACYGGFTTRLNDEFLLDWHNALEHPSVARPHMYVAADRNAPFAVKLSRMEHWAQAITAYDSIMEKERRENFTCAELESILKAGQLPRPYHVELSTGSEGLKKLFKTLGFPQRRVEDGPTWKRLALCAGSGELVEEWVKLKKKK